MRSIEMPAGSLSPEIEVDFDGLRDIATDLHVLAREIGDRDSILQDQLGEPALAMALRHAEQDWSAHRRRLQSLLDDAGRAVEDSLASYRQTEDQLARAAGRG